MPGNLAYFALVDLHSGGVTFLNTGGKRLLSYGSDRLPGSKVNGIIFFHQTVLRFFRVIPVQEMVVTNLKLALG